MPLHNLFQSNIGCLRLIGLKMREYTFTILGLRLQRDFLYL